jgi:hypothetical protein
MSKRIRGNTVLPARREALKLQTADGLDLVGELALPPESDPVATLVCFHPLPTHGGMMDSHLYRKPRVYLAKLILSHAKPASDAVADDGPKCEAVTQSGLRAPARPRV